MSDPHSHPAIPQSRITKALALTVTALVVIITACTSSAAEADQTATRTRNHPTQLRVMTFNIRHGEASDGTFDLAATAAAIRAQHPDVVALQEVDGTWSDRSNWSDEPKELGRMLNMHASFAPIYDLPPASMGADDQRYGVAILSRHPIIESTNHQITRLSTQVQNAVAVPAPGFGEIAIRVGHREVHIYNTHLDYRADPSVRATQVAETVQYLKYDPAPTILTGDFNANPDAPELQPLLDQQRDIWGDLGEKHPATYPADAPTEAIDYIAVSKQWKTKRVSVPDTQVSDHRPVVADLILS